MPESEPLPATCCGSTAIRTRSVERSTRSATSALALIPLDRALLVAAGSLVEPALRALDAIHVAAAADISPLDAFVTHDERQAAAVRLAGIRTLAPGR